MADVNTNVNANADADADADAASRSPRGQKRPAQHTLGPDEQRRRLLLASDHVHAVDPVRVPLVANRAGAPQTAACWSLRVVGTKGDDVKVAKCWPRSAAFVYTISINTDTPPGLAGVTTHPGGATVTGFAPRYVARAKHGIATHIWCHACRAENPHIELDAAVLDSCCSDAALRERIAKRDVRPLKSVEEYIQKHRRDACLAAAELRALALPDTFAHATYRALAAGEYVRVALGVYDDLPVATTIISAEQHAKALRPYLMVRASGAEIAAIDLYINSFVRPLLRRGTLMFDPQAVPARTAAKRDRAAEKEADASPEGPPVAAAAVTVAAGHEDKRAEALHVLVDLGVVTPGVPFVTSNADADVSAGEQTCFFASALRRVWPRHLKPAYEWPAADDFEREASADLVTRLCSHARKVGVRGCLIGLVTTEGNTAAVAAALLPCAHSVGRESVGGGGARKNRAASGGGDTAARDGERDRVASMRAHFANVNTLVVVARRSDIRAASGVLDNTGETGLRFVTHETLRTFSSSTARVDLVIMCSAELMTLEDLDRVVHIYRRPAVLLVRGSERMHWRERAAARGLRGCVTLDAVFFPDFVHATSQVLSIDMPVASLPALQRCASHIAHLDLTAGAPPVAVPGTQLRVVVSNDLTDLVRNTSAKRVVLCLNFCARYKLDGMAMPLARLDGRRRLTPARGPVPRVMFCDAASLDLSAFEVVVWTGDIALETPARARRLAAAIAAQPRAIVACRSQVQLVRLLGKLL